MVYHKEGGQITAGAFKIKSDFFDYPAAKLYKGGGNSNTILSGLAVPAGLLLLQQTVGGGTNLQKSTDEIINDTLYDKLLNLASNKKIKNKTKKYNQKSHNKRTTKKTKH